MIEYQIGLKVFNEGPPFFADGIVNFKDMGEKKFHLKHVGDIVSLKIFDPVTFKEEYYQGVLVDGLQPIDKQQAEHALKFLLLTYIKSQYGKPKTELPISPGGGGLQT